MSGGGFEAIGGMAHPLGRMPEEEKEEEEDEDDHEDDEEEEEEDDEDLKTDPRASPNA